MVSEIPPLGLGTFGRTGAAGIEALLTAMEIGYRHIDTAQSYDTESTVGAAVRRSGLARDSFFVTTKIANTNLDRSRFGPSLERSIDTLGIGPVDLLLIHWPSENDTVPLEYYLTALSEAQQRGQARLIGVSNFTAALLDRSVALLGPGAIATNQVEIHPYLQTPRLCAHAKAIGVNLTAYQPLAKGRVAADPVLLAMAGRHGVSASAIALAFLMAEGHGVIPASSSEAHLRTNFAASGVTLDSDEIAAIRKLDRGMRVINPPMSPLWDD